MTEESILSLSFLLSLMAAPLIMTVVVNAGVKMMGPAENTEIVKSCMLEILAHSDLPNTYMSSTCFMLPEANTDVGYCNFWSFLNAFFHVIAPKW